MTTLFLVSCSATKQAQACAAKDLYASQLFTLSRRYVERTKEPWAILSAKYGLLLPEDTIEPYNESLTWMSADEQRAWALRLQPQLAQLLSFCSADKVVFLAGQAYRQHLIPWLKERQITVRVPMEGLFLGEQICWLGTQLMRGAL